MFTDDFNVANTTTPPSWYELTGDWGISGFTLVEDYSTGTDGTANAVIICTEQQPAAHAGEQYLQVKCIPETGDFYYLYPCASSPTSISGALVVEFECTTAPSQWTVRVGSDTQSYTGVTADGFGYVTIGACVDEPSGMMKAWILQSAEQGLWAESVSPGTGRYSAFGHNNESHLNVFDDYVVGELRSTDGTECNDCFCRCLAIAMPKELTLTVTDATGRASCAGGYTCTLTWEWNSGTSRWKGNYTVVNGAYSQYFEWCLVCDTEGDTDPLNPGQNFSLSLCGLAACSSSWPSGSLTVFNPISGTTCDPLRLVFGPMQVTNLDLACQLCSPPGTGDGEYYIEITL